MDQPTPTQQPPAQAHGIMSQLENFFDTYLHKKAPFHIPPAGKEFIVKFGPWITLVLMLLAIPVILAGLGLMAAFSPAIMAYGQYSTQYLLQSVLSLVVLIMEAVALPGLFKRSLSGWKLVYYAALLSAVGQLITFSIVALIVDLVITMYVLFEIRDYYK